MGERFVGDGGGDGGVSAGYKTGYLWAVYSRLATLGDPLSGVCGGGCQVLNTVLNRLPHNPFVPSQLCFLVPQCTFR